MSLETKIDEDGKLETILTVKSVFIYDEDEEQEKNFPIKKLQLFILNIASSKKEYIFFFKEKNGKRIYYIPIKGGYIKLWRVKSNIVAFKLFKKPLKVISYKGVSEADWQSIYIGLNIEGFSFL